MLDSKKMVSVIVPCRNEKGYIGRCLGSVLAQDYPKDKIEIFVVDGMSEDGTREIIKQYADKYPFIRMLDNCRQVIPVALNIGIRESRGEFIIRMDAHSEYPGDYISKCVNNLDTSDADNVGGMWRIMPGSQSETANAIALSLSSRFGVGNALYRVGIKEPRYVDTVPFGCYRRKIFEKLGLFDEGSLRSEDDEFNARLIRAGGKILLVPDIVSYYYARDIYPKLWKTYYQYGYFKPLTVLKLRSVFTLRQLIPGALVVSLIILCLVGFFNKFTFFLFLIESVVYIAANFIFSFLIAAKNKMQLLPYLMIAFAVLHFSYGIGYLKGILDFMVFQKHLRGKIKDIPITR